jgi:hypothetical protein
MNWKEVNKIAKFEYITVLDYSDGQVYQYENLEHLKDGWSDDDGESIEWYLTETCGHRLEDIHWMSHRNPEIVTP